MLLQKIFEPIVITYIAKGWWYMRFFLFLAKGGLIAITPHKTASEIRGRTDKDTSQTKAITAQYSHSMFLEGWNTTKNISNIYLRMIFKSKVLSW